MPDELDIMYPYKIALARKPATRILFYVTKEEKAMSDRKALFTDEVRTLLSAFKLENKEVESAMKEMGDEARQAFVASLKTLQKWNSEFPPEAQAALGVLAHVTSDGAPIEVPLAKVEEPKEPDVLPVGDSTPADNSKIEGIVTSLEGIVDSFSKLLTKEKTVENTPAPKGVPQEISAKEIIEAVGVALEQAVKELTENAT